MSQEDFENIEKYLQGSLKGASLDDFIKRISDDLEFAKTIEEQRLLQDAIEEDGIRNLLEDFHINLEDKKEQHVLQSSTQVRSLKPWKRYAAAACIAILLSWGGFMLLKGDISENRNEELFAAHFTPDPGLPTTMSIQDNFEFFNAMVSYKQGDYYKAITKWQPLLKEKPKNDTLTYFLGVANLANGDENEAITFLQWAAEHQDSHFLSDAYYYLGLAHLKAGNKVSAKNALEKSNLNKSKDLISVILKMK